MTRPLRARVTVITHQGCVRAHNEDTVAVGRWIRNAPMKAPIQTVHDLDAPLLCLVADGMGGHAAGEEASRLAAFRLSERIPDVEDEKSVEALLHDVNRAVFDAMDAPGGLQGMGTTIVGMVLRPAGVLHFNVGDSRLYRHRDGYLRQLSIDDVPAIGPDAGEGRARRSHRLTQALGGAEAFVEIAPHIGTQPLAAGWRYLLCSDGLTDMLDLDSIETRVGADDEISVMALLDAALAAGGEDNISILLASIEEVAMTGQGGPA